MTQRRLPVAVFAALVGIGISTPAISDPVSDVERTVEQQQRRIEQLETEQRKLLERLEAIDAARTAAGASADTVRVTPEYVDERIQDFEQAAESRFLVSGYGDVEFVDVENGTTAFAWSFNPGFHFRMAEDLHFNAELEFEMEVEDGEVKTEFDLEFAQIDYLATDWLALSVGKFLTPFNTFGPRLHPSWINRLGSAPPIYGGHDSGGFIPVLRSIGFMASGGQALWSDDAKMNYAVYVANGSTGEELSDPPTEDELLDLDFNNTPSLDDAVTLGGRLGVLPIGNLEIGVSYMTADPDSARYHLVGTDAWYSWEGLELRGEFAYLERDSGGVDADVWGYWVQGGYRLRYLFPEQTGFSGFLNRLEPVVRWGEVRGFSEKNREQLALGLNYWLFESAPLRIMYELNDGAPDDNRLLVQFAYGF